MIRRLTTLASLTIALLVVPYLATADSGPKAWQPINSNALINLADNAKSDQDYVDTMTHILDRGLTELRAHPPVYFRAEFAYSQIADIVRLIGVGRTTDSQNRVAALESEIANLPPDVDNRTEVHDLLTVGLALCGVKVDESILLAALRNGKYMDPLRSAAIDAMAATKVPIQAIPDLVAMKSSNYTRLAYVAVDRTEANYPIREAVARCLSRLGIRATLIRGDDITSVEIDRPSLVTALRLWIIGGTASERGDAIGAAGRLQGSDIDNMLRQASAAPKLPMDDKALINAVLEKRKAH